MFFKVSQVSNYPSLSCCRRPEEPELAPPVAAELSQPGNQAFTVVTQSYVYGLPLLNITETAGALATTPFKPIPTSAAAWLTARMGSWRRMRIFLYSLAWL